ncbi:MAG: restriction endonuclease [Deltaproteobacteria bacterium]
MSKEYTKKLEGIIRQMLAPLKGIPLNLVIEGISGRKIIPFDGNDTGDARILEKLKKAAIIAGGELNKTGIKRSRPNEVGNDIESFVKSALTRVGYRADTPVAKSGKGKAAGYPDIEFFDESGRPNYLECKTYNIENIATTQRSFYLSPSDDFKVTKDAHHFVLSFEIYSAGKIGKNNIYKSKGWKILSIEMLDVDVKYEFNSDNKRLYTKGLILAEGNL